jgi:hypothetical protein
MLKTYGGGGGVTFFIQGCGTIIHGSQQNLEIGTTPPGAVATIGSQQCVTPCTLEVSRRARYIELEKSQTRKKLPLSKELNVGAVFFGNLWFSSRADY